MLLPIIAGARLGGHRRRVPADPSRPHDRARVTRPAAGGWRRSAPRRAAAALRRWRPASVLAHALNPTYTSRLPLAVYLAGAAATVALSFLFVLVRDVRAERPDLSAPGHLPPAAIRYRPARVGLLGWAWIIAQGIVGGESAGDVATALPVGLRLGRRGDAVGLRRAGLALPRPVLDPPRPGAWVLRRLGIAPWDLADYPARLGRWPAAIGFIVVVWLELVLEAGPGIALHRRSSATPR